MTTRRVLQMFVVVLASIAGYLWSRPPEAGSHAAALHGDKAGAAGSASSGGSARARVPRMRWRRGDDVTPAAFEPVVVAFERLPREEKLADTVRDPAWAGPMERGLEDLVVREMADVFPAVEVKPVRCMSATCRVDLEMPGEYFDRIMAFVQTVTVLGPRVSPEFDETRGPTVTLGFTVKFDDLANADEWQAWHARVRDDRHEQDDKIITAEKEGRPWLHGEPWER